MHQGPFRLVGLAAYDIARQTEPQQFDLFANDGSARLEKTVDNILQKFGGDTLKRAGDLAGNKTVSGESPNLDFID